MVDLALPSPAQGGCLAGGMQRDALRRPWEEPFHFCFRCSSWVRPSFSSNFDKTSQKFVAKTTGEKRRCDYDALRCITMHDNALQCISSCIMCSAPAIGRLPGSVRLVSADSEAT